MGPGEGQERPLRMSDCRLRIAESGIACHAFAGHDAVAAMASTLSGAYHGFARLPRRFLNDLEYHARLIELADGLCDLSRRLRGTL